jgi:hypothetical protein
MLPYQLRDTQRIILRRFVNAGMNHGLTACTAPTDWRSFLRRTLKSGFNEFLYKIREICRSFCKDSQKRIFRMMSSARYTRPLPLPQRACIKERRKFLALPIPFPQKRDKITSGPPENVLCARHHCYAYRLGPDGEPGESMTTEAVFNRRQTYSWELISLDCPMCLWSSFGILEASKWA